MSKFLNCFLCLLLFLFLNTWSKELNYVKAPNPKKPLIMENADSLAVSQKRGQYLLYGNVRFIHDSTKVFTNRAIWNRNRDIVQCLGGFKVFNPSVMMSSKTGTYDRRKNEATAVGNAVFRDTSNNLALFGERLFYDREDEIVIIPAKPVIQRYYAPKKTDVKPDTLEIRARYMEYRDSNKVAKALGGVEVIRGDLLVTCDTAFFNRDSNLLYLKGNPICRMNTNTISGDFMKIKLKNESLKSILVIDNAKGNQKSKKQGESPGNYAEVHGDTIYAEFRDNGKMKLIKASIDIENKQNSEARGYFLEDDLNDFINEMYGASVNIDFNTQGKMKKAVIRGRAKSKYWYVTNERKVEGQNEAHGDSIVINFGNSQVESLQILGDVATGVFYENENKASASKELENQTTSDSNSTSNVKLPKPSIKSNSKKAKKKDTLKNNFKNRPRVK